MRSPSAMTLAFLLFAAGTALFLLVFTHKTTPAPTTLNLSEDEHKVSAYIAEVERKNELERDQIEQARKLAKQTRAKKDSPECQFWMLQKAKSATPNPKTDEKINQFCEPEGTISKL